MAKVIKNRQCWWRKPLNNKVLLSSKTFPKTMRITRNILAGFPLWLHIAKVMNETGFFKCYRKIAQVFVHFGLFIAGLVLQFVFAAAECANRTTWRRKKKYLMKPIKRWNDVDIHVKLYPHKIFKCDIFA